MSTPAKQSSGIKTAKDGSSYIPSSRRADGSTRKEIKVRPGYKPPEDVETYKSRSTGQGKSVPGVDVPGVEDESAEKSRNAKKREAARRKKEGLVNTSDADMLTRIEKAVSRVDLGKHQPDVPQSKDQSDPALGSEDSAEMEKQKKIRSLLKKLRAIEELKEKKAGGEKLSPEQVMKIARESDIVQDLGKLGYVKPQGEAELETAALAEVS